MKIQICSQICQATLASKLCPENACRNGLTDLAKNLDFHLVGYRGHISLYIEKSEQFHFRFKGPSTSRLL